MGPLAVRIHPARPVQLSFWGTVVLCPWWCRHNSACLSTTLISLHWQNSWSLTKCILKTNQLSNWMKVHVSASQTCPDNAPSYPFCNYICVFFQGCPPWNIPSSHCPVLLCLFSFKMLSSQLAKGRKQDSMVESFRIHSCVNAGGEIRKEMFLLTLPVKLHDKQPLQPVQSPMSSQ